jgi:hypothetical protein
MASSHRVLRIHGGRLVNGDRRLELETELDAGSEQGFELAESFAIDDNVYLILRRPG